MPIRFHITDRTLVYSVVGEVEYAEGLDVLRAGIEAARRRAGGAPLDLMFDIRESTENRSAEELRGIAATLADRRDILTGRGVVVVADGLHYGLSRMFEAYAQEFGVDIHVCATPEEARAWLEQGPGSLQAGP